jgi:ribonuclease HI
MFYAVHKGHKPGIYGNWLDCKKQIDKYEGAIFKKFEKKDDALAFVKDGFGQNKVPRGITRKLNSDKKNNDAIENETLNDTSPKIFIYTDGSCIKVKNGLNKAGFGIYIPEKNIQVSAPLLNQKLTNNRAEMTAIIDSIKYLDEDDLTKKLCIFTDSQYSIYIFTGTGERYEKNGWKNEGKDVPNIDLIKKALDIKRTYNIVLLKIRAHTDKQDEHSIGNDIADKLANEGAMQCGQISDQINHKKNIFEGDYFDNDTFEYISSKPINNDEYNNEHNDEVNEELKPIIKKNIKMNDLLDFSSSKIDGENEKIFSVLSNNIKNNDNINKKIKFKSSKLSEWFVK